MPSFADESALLAAPKQPFLFQKASLTAEGAGTFHSLWLAAGNPIAGVAPPTAAAGSGRIPTRTTAGAFPINNPAGDNELGAMALEAVGPTTGTLILYDRLWACSGLVGNVTTLQSITTPETVTRPDGLGVDVEIFGEVYTAMGATGSVFTVTYLDDLGVSRTATYTMPANALSVGQMVPFIAAGAWKGCRRVDSLQLSISTGTAGNFGITLMRRIAEIPLSIANVQAFKDYLALGLPDVPNDACLALAVLCTTTNTGLIQGRLTLAEGLL